MHSCIHYKLPLDGIFISYPFQAWESEGRPSGSFDPKIRFLDEYEDDGEEATPPSEAAAAGPPRRRLASQEPPPPTYEEVLAMKEEEVVYSEAAARNRDGNPYIRKKMHMLKQYATLNTQDWSKV